MPSGNRITSSSVNQRPALHVWALACWGLVLDTFNTMLALWLTLRMDLLNPLQTGIPHNDNKRQPALTERKLKEAGKEGTLSAIGVTLKAQTLLLLLLRTIRVTPITQMVKGLLPQLDHSWRYLWAGIVSALAFLILTPLPRTSRPAHLGSSWNKVQPSQSRNRPRGTWNRYCLVVDLFPSPPHF